MPPKIHIDDPPPARTANEFNEALVEATNDLLEEVMFESAEAIEVGEDLPDDGDPADVVDEHGVRWRLELGVVRRKLV